jgi:hypothetical protein
MQQTADREFILQAADQFISSYLPGRNIKSCRLGTTREGQRASFREKARQSTDSRPIA